MADLSITPAQVLPSTGAKYLHGIAGEALTAGEVVYKKSSDGRYWKADADVEASADADGLVVAEAEAAGAGVLVQYAGDITLGAGAAPTQGQTYVVSATAGGIGLEGELASDDYLTYLGYGIGTNAVRLMIKATGIAHA